MTDLNFLTHAKSAFDFLAMKGFLEVEDSPFFISWEKDKVSVSVSHNRFSFEVDVDVQFLDERYSIFDLLRAEGAHQHDRVGMATTELDLFFVLKKEANYLKQRGDEALLGNTNFFKKIEYQRMHERKRHQQEMITDQARRNALHAFSSGEYDLAVRIFREIEGQLRPSEQAKLKYSQERSKK